MASTSYTSVAKYLAAQPKAARLILDQVRRAIRKAVPTARETIAYQIPAYKIDGTTVLFFAGWKSHYSLYPAGPRLVAKFRKELAPYEVNDKGTIRFPLNEPVPVLLIGRIAKYRLEEMALDAKPKTSPKKKTATKKVRAKVVPRNRS